MSHSFPHRIYSAILLTFVCSCTIPNQAARDANRSYLQSCAFYSLKIIFDNNSLDLAKVGKAIGFAVPPKVNISCGFDEVGIGAGMIRMEEVMMGDQRGEKL